MSKWGHFKKSVKKSVKKAVKAVAKGGEDLVKASLHPDEMLKSAIQPVVDTAESAFHYTEGVIKDLKGDEAGAEKAYNKAAGDLTKTAAATTMGGVGEIVAPKLLEKAENVGEKYGAKAYEAVTQPLEDTLIGAREDLQSMGALLQGDVKGFEEKFVDARRDMAKGGAGTMVPFAQAVAPQVIETAGDISEAINSYATFNFNRGSEKTEELTGWDVDNSRAEAKEAAAKAEYQAKVNEANRISQNNLRANLLSLRKTLQRSFSRSSQGGPASGNEKNSGVGGIILG